MTKQQLRRLYREKRNAISASEKMKMDDLMLLQFQQLDFMGVESVLSYWPLGTNAEPNTHLFTQYLEFLIPELKLSYPKTNFIDNSMVAVLINDNTSFITNEKGLTEPEAGQEISLQNIDLVLVPMFICDENGYRVGFGKGFYDRFLQYFKNDVVTIGFSYFDPVDTIEDINQFDIPLDLCITPHKIFTFSAND